MVDVPAGEVTPGVTLNPSLVPLIDIIVAKVRL